MSLPRPALLLLLLTACTSAPAPEAPAPPAASAPPAAPTLPRRPAPARLLAMGDVHGDYDALRQALRLGGLIDAGEHWAAGPAMLVQTGDLLDRGDDEPQILALFERLEDEAKAAGGEVVALNGNHEFMNALGDLRYVTEDGFRDFADGAGGDLGALAVAEQPPEARGRAAAFAPGSPWALRLGERDVVAIIGDTVFVHGGVLPPTARYGIPRLNTEAKAWLRGAGPLPELLVVQDGPVWSRHFGGDAAGVDCGLLDEALSILGARRMVIGHTVQEQGINAACGEKVWRIDVGMSKAYGGRAQLLEITAAGARPLGPVTP